MPQEMINTELQCYDIGQKDWDVIRKHGLVNFNSNEIISPKVLEMMTDEEVQSVFKVSKTLCVNATGDDKY
jgi:hypothetical protein